MSREKRFIPETIRGSATAEGLISTQSGEFHYTIRLRDCDRIRCLFDLFEIRAFQRRAICRRAIPVAKKTTLSGRGAHRDRLGGPEKRTVLRSATPEDDRHKNSFLRNRG